MQICFNSLKKVLGHLMSLGYYPSNKYVKNLEIYNKAEDA